MHLPEHYISHNMIPLLKQLRAAAVTMEHAYHAQLNSVAPLFQDSARNLLHYLALRQSDIADLQKDLALLGLSRLGRVEAHALSSMDAVLDALHALVDLKRSDRVQIPAIDIRTGCVHLNKHADALLGAASERHLTRIMVTMPSEAATDAGIIRELLAAGMTIMRINCAHDEPDAWLAMIEHLRAAEHELGLTCKIYADLAGPKLRTGEIRAIGRLIEFKVKRDAWGHITKPASAWLTPSDQQEIAVVEVDGVLPLDRTFLACLRLGDVVEVDDSRGKTRQFIVTASFGASWLAHCDHHAFITEGAVCRLNRDDIEWAQGVVGQLPEVFLPIVLKAGDVLTLTRGKQPGEPAAYDDQGNLLRTAFIPCTLDAVFDAVETGHPIWFDDGKIGGQVLSNDGNNIEVTITQADPQGSKLRAEKGINLPHSDLNTPAMTKIDTYHLRVLAPHIDIIGLSFVRSADDVLTLHHHLRENGAAHLGTVLKIETRQAFENLPMILLTSLNRPPVGVMVARGDLAVEIGFERLAEVQEEILWLCEAAHIPVIWATQVLESMAKSGMPSRAEVSDAALSIRAECVMLNKGPYMVETVRFLSGLLARMSRNQVKRRSVMRHLSVSQSLSHGDSAQQIEI
ncbi:MAG: pyruvate kinase [Gallionella sp.]|jgi:pyruvate kinase